MVDYWKQQSKSGGVFLNYGKEEKMLMAYLQENEKITLSAFTKLARTGRAEAEKILVDLLLLKVIRIEITEKAVYYRLN
jgi:predicted HTH transcriptional regulator